MDKNNNAVVVFSGGQDSTTCLLWAIKKFDKVGTKYEEMANYRMMNHDLYLEKVDNR